MILTLFFLTTTVLQTIVGVDGTTCTIYKTSGSTIAAGVKCVSSSGLAIMGPLPIKSTDTTPTFMEFSFSQSPNDGPLFAIGINPTTMVATAGSMPPIPPNGISWTGTDGKGTRISGSSQWP